MDLIVKNPQLAVWGGSEFRCAVGQGGFIAAADKREDDGATPVGRWKMREVFYRADRLPPLATALPLHVMHPDDAWCDVSGDPMYNKRVKLPYATLDEKLWRADAVYDVVVVLGYNDDPVIEGKGSAIFLHIARPAFAPTAGCVAIAQKDLLTLLRDADADSAVDISPA